MKITVVGTGYVGLTTTIGLAYAGHEVIAVDSDESKLAKLSSGISPIYEPGMDSFLVELLPCIRFSSSVRESVPESEVVLIAVGTPSKPNGEADMQYVEQAVVDVAQSIRPNQTCTLVIKSTVPMGTSDRMSSVVERLLRDRGVEASVSFAFCPEFLREGFALKDTLYPERIIIGSSDETARETCCRLYSSLIEQSFVPPASLPRPTGYSKPLLIKTDAKTAEMSKYAANAFLALKISYINEIAGLCEKIGANVSEVSSSIGADSRIGSRFLNAGLGWGGSCLPKDTAALIAIAGEHEYQMPIVEATRRVNYGQRRLLVTKLEERLGTLEDRTIGVLGLAFKPNTDDVRESPAIDVIGMLAKRGAKVRAHDPIAIPNAAKQLDGLDVEFVQTSHDAATGVDALIVATDWDEYRRLDLEAHARLMNNPVLIDGRNLYDRDKVRAAGLDYVGMGR